MKEIVANKSLHLVEKERNVKKIIIQDASVGDREMEHLQVSSLATAKYPQGHDSQGRIFSQGR